MATNVSVIIPNYNGGSFLASTLESVCSQHDTQTEIIVIDGGSSDKSLEIIKQYEDRIGHWISEKDQGQSDAINKGLQLCTGEVVNWVNSDDILVPGAIKRIRDAFEKHQKADFIYGDTQIIDEAGRILQTRPEIGFCGFVQRYGGNLFAQPSCFFRRESAERLGWLNSKLHWSMDYDLYLRALNRNMQFKFVPGVVSQFRLHGRSKTGSQHQRFIQEHFKVHCSQTDSWLLRRRFVYRTLKVAARSWRIFALWRQRGVWQPRRYTKILATVGHGMK